MYRDSRLVLLRNRAIFWPANSTISRLLGGPLRPAFAIVNKGTEDRIIFVWTILHPKHPIPHVIVRSTRRQEVQDDGVRRRDLYDPHHCPQHSWILGHGESDLASPMRRTILPLVYTHFDEKLPQSLSSDDPLIYQRLAH